MSKTTPLSPSHSPARVGECFDHLVARQGPLPVSRAGRVHTCLPLSSGTARGHGMPWRGRPGSRPRGNRSENGKEPGYPDCDAWFATTRISDSVDNRVAICCRRDRPLPAGPASRKTNRLRCLRFALFWLRNYAGIALHPRYTYDSEP